MNKFNCNVGEPLCIEGVCAVHRDLKAIGVVPGRKGTCCIIELFITIQV